MRRGHSYKQTRQVTTVRTVDNRRVMAGDNVDIEEGVMEIPIEITEVEEEEEEREEEGKYLFDM